MPLYRFPNLLGVPPANTPEGVVAIGGNLDPENLIAAYRKGIFPWPIPESDCPLAWFSPHPRAILDFRELHVPRSLRRAQNAHSFTFTHDQAFCQVIEACKQTPRPGQSGTWITDEMVAAYTRLHELGMVHSFEAWATSPESGNRELVGGVYGVAIDGAFAGESMFHRKPHASKLTLIHMADYFTQKGLTWMDIQMMTPHMKLLGAKEISRDEYLSKLSQTRALKLKVF